MKKLIHVLWITGILSLLSSSNIQACDVCGCSVGSGYFGILPQFQKNFIGLRYQYRAFDSEHLVLFQGEKPLRTQEVFHTTELWARYVPHKRIHLFAFLPYNYYTKDEEQIHSVVSGIGDVSLVANYIIFNTGEQAGGMLKHALQFGVGVKLPTGKSNHTQEHTGLLVPSLQVGTGAFDAPLNLIYTIRYKQLGMNIEGNYRINTINKRGYKFGDRVNSSLRFFYWQKMGNVSLLPHIGTGIEYGFWDKKDGEKQEYTESTSIMGNAGLDLYYKRIIVNFSTQLPFYQYIAKGQITGKQRFSVGLSVLIDKAK
jgi:hypothetical protein